MRDIELMAFLKSNLDLISVDSGKQGYLGQCLASARTFIEREGIPLSEDVSIEDGQLIVMYAAYLYRKRATDEPMPRMLRYALNNRLFALKAGDENGS